MGTIQRRRPARWLALLILGALPSAGQGPWGGPGGAQPEQQGRRGGQAGRGSGPFVFRTEVPKRPFDIVLGNPTASSIAAKVLAYQPVEGYIEFGPSDGAYSRRTETVQFKAGEPREVAIDGLVGNSEYRYRFRSRSGPATPFDESAEFGFRTPRSAGESFVFTVVADSHLDRNTDPAIYERTIRDSALAKPDFHVDLGDTFMVDQRRDDFRAAAEQYVAQRYYFGLIGNTASVFLVSGNHDGEGSFLGEMGRWSVQQRRTYFATPSDVLDRGGNYYSWEWGDALFVALDPYWITQRRGPRGSAWARTLGKDQYDWLTRTLETSEAKFKFVFIHHLVGGLNQAARGGAEAAALYEWGGRNGDGSPGFARQRSGWGKPIHEILVNTGVTAVFHGHDHVYAKEDLDGIVYQLVPQPGLARFGTPRMTRNLYPESEFVPGPGHLRVTVGPGSVLVELVQPKVGERERRIAHSYRAEPRCGGDCQ